MNNTEKEVYLRPEIEIIPMDGHSDIITTSQTGTDLDENPFGEG